MQHKDIEYLEEFKGQLSNDTELFAGLKQDAVSKHHKEHNNIKHQIKIETEIVIEIAKARESGDKKKIQQLEKKLKGMGKKHHGKHKIYRLVR
jgi:hypothetical protein